ncbi:chitinase [Streptomyces katsurahamanus]|uniref:chitinase n=1 Tax=Streptomyces katsurahamanus TaxID=2577098 RepID=UPI0018866E86|nr:chitinase [Streptomyces katsurahamanus]
MLARDLAGNRSALSHAVTGTTRNPSPPRTLPTAPYVDMGAWPTPSLSTLASDSGLKNFSLGAITSPTCKAMWFNYYDPRTGWAKDNIDALRAAGGEVKVTFGGAGGRELAQNCESVDALFTEYDAVVRQYGLRYVDFDIEGPAVNDPVSIARRSAALARLQQTHPDLRISLTLPVTPSGLTQTGLSVVTSARDAALQAAQATVTQLKSLYPSRTDAQLWGMAGVTPMTGENDDHQIYDQADARQLVAFAQSRNLGLIAFLGRHPRPQRLHRKSLPVHQRPAVAVRVLPHRRLLPGLNGEVPPIEGTTVPAPLRAGATPGLGTGGLAR